VKSEDYEEIQSRMQTEHITRLDGSTTMKIWEYFETKVTGNNFSFSIQERGGAEFLKGEIDLVSGKSKLTRTFGEISKKNYKVEEITVQEDGTKILRLRFEYGILPRDSTLRLQSN
jgi:hypothetical protein